MYGHLSTNTVTRIPQRYLLNTLGETPYMSMFFNLASSGVYIASRVTVRAVGSYPAFSTLPIIISAVLSVALSLKSPPPGFLRHPVSKTLGLSSLTVSLRPRDRITFLKGKAIVLFILYSVKKFLQNSIQKKIWEQSIAPTLLLRFSFKKNFF